MLNTRFGLKIRVLAALNGDDEIASAFNPHLTAVSGRMASVASPLCEQEEEEEEQTRYFNNPL